MTSTKTTAPSRVAVAQELNSRGYLAKDGIGDEAGPRQFMTMAPMFDYCSFGVDISWKAKPVSALHIDELRKLEAEDSDLDKLRDRGRASLLLAGTMSVFSVMGATLSSTAAYIAHEKFSKITPQPTHEQYASYRGQATDDCVERVTTQYKPELKAAVAKAFHSPEHPGFVRSGAEMAHAVELCRPFRMDEIHAEKMQADRAAGATGVAGAVVLTAMTAYMGSVVVGAFRRARDYRETIAVRAGNAQVVKNELAVRQGKEKSELVAS